MPHVLHELTILRVFLPANAAQMRLVPGVRHHVNFVRHFLRESLIAHFTDEGFLPRVQPPVIDQLPVGGESLRTNTAGERFLSQMRFHVIGVSIALRKALIADVTRVGFVPGVKAHVTL